MDPQVCHEKQDLNKVRLNMCKTFPTKRAQYIYIYYKNYIFRRSLLISLRSQMNLNLNAPKGIGLPPASPSDKESNVDVSLYIDL